MCAVHDKTTRILAAIAQLGERQTEDLKVPGSIPGGGILQFPKRDRAWRWVTLRAGEHHGILAEWLRRLIRNQLGTFPREFESLRCRFFFSSDGPRVANHAVGLH